MIFAISGSTMSLGQAAASGLGTFALLVVAVASVVTAGSVAYGVFVLYARQLQLLEKEGRQRAAKAQRDADAPPAPLPVAAAPAPPQPPIVITIPVPMPVQSTTPAVPTPPAAPHVPLSAQPIATNGQPLPPKLIAVLTAAVAVAVGRPFVIKHITPLPSTQPASVSTWKERGRLNIHDSHTPRKRSR